MAIVNEDGVMETAYEIIDMDYDSHFKKDGYYFLGKYAIGGNANN